MSDKKLTIVDILAPKLGSAISIKAILENYKKRYVTYIENNVKVHTSYIKNKDIYVIYTKIPSESNHKYEKELYYDIVVEFHPIDKSNKDEADLKNYQVKVYSNSPSFIYTFTNLFNENGWLSEYIPKKYYIKKALTDKAKVRNPMQIQGLEKSIWFTMFYIKSTRLYKKNVFKSHDKLPIKELINKVTTQNELMIKSKKRQDTKIVEKKTNKSTKQRKTNTNKLDRKLTSEMKNDLRTNLSRSTKTNNLKNGLKKKL